MTYYRNLDRSRELRRDQFYVRQARKLGRPYEDIMAATVFERDGWVCGLCLEPIDQTLRFPDRMSVSLDHIIPVAMGGTHTYANVQAAHLDCNQRKGVGLERAS